MIELSSRKDLVTGMSADASSDLDTLLSELGRKDLELFGPNPAIERIKQIGSPVIPKLLTILEGDNWNAVVDAIGLLAAMNAKEAVPKLHLLSKSKWAEVSSASLAALALLDRKPSGLRLDRENAYGQIGQLWTAIFQARKMLYSADELRAYCQETIAAWPQLKFPAKYEESGAWAMVGSLYYKSQDPEWHGGPDGIRKGCAEAAMCYQRA